MHSAARHRVTVTIAAAILGAAALVTAMPARAASAQAPPDLPDLLRRIQSTCFALYPPEMLRQMSGSAAQAPETIRDDPRGQVKYLKSEEKVARGLFYPSILEDLLPAFSATVRPESRVLDLGSGDGRVVFMAALLGARAEGVEFDRALHGIALEARGRLRDRIDPARAVLRRGDFFAEDFRPYDILFYYGSGCSMEARLLDKLRREMNESAVLILAYPATPPAGFRRVADYAGVGLYRPGPIAAP
jgi:SAM-dependent methyltransferase